MKNYAYLYTLAAFVVAGFSLARLIMSYIDPPRAVWCQPIIQNQLSGANYVLDDNADDGCAYGEELVDIVDMISLVYAFF